VVLRGNRGGKEAVGSRRGPVESADSDLLAPGWVGRKGDMSAKGGKRKRRTFFTERNPARNGERGGTNISIHSKSGKPEVVMLGGVRGLFRKREISKP